MKKVPNRDKNICQQYHNAQLSIYAIISPYNKALHSVIYPQLLYLKLKGQRQEPEQSDSEEQIIQP